MCCRLIAIVFVQWYFTSPKFPAGLKRLLVKENATCVVRKRRVRKRSGEILLVAFSVSLRSR
ncbi:hypothetical protein RRSWK_05635 [Rhodopirellula sp. SWK7]|nr:hypothetical protein RRSWK_05635 [Rhodopirellula sp. SWK7]